MLNIFNTASNNEFITGIVLLLLYFFFYLQLFANKKCSTKAEHFLLSINCILLI